MELARVLVRFVHYGASLVLFGLLLFPLYAYPPVAGRARLRALAISRSVSLLVFISGVLWFIGVRPGSPAGWINSSVVLPRFLQCLDWTKTRESQTTAEVPQSDN